MRTQVFPRIHSLTTPRTARIGMTETAGGALPPGMVIGPDGKPCKVRCSSPLPASISEGPAANLAARMLIEPFHRLAQLSGRSPASRRNPGRSHRREETLSPPEPPPRLPRQPVPSPQAVHSQVRRLQQNQFSLPTVRPTSNGSADTPGRSFTRPPRTSLLSRAGIKSRRCSASCEHSPHSIPAACAPTTSANT